MHSFMKNAEHVIKHAVMHKVIEGSKEGPVTTGVGTAVGTTALIAATVATGGLALAPIATAALSGAFLGFIGGGLMGNVTKK